MIDVVEFFKALSDETRLRIMVLLAQKELCVCEICDLIGESQPKVSRHLAKLRAMNFVQDERKGQWVFYRLEKENKTVSEILDVLMDTIVDHQSLLEDMRKLHEKVRVGKFCERLEDDIYE